MARKQAAVVAGAFVLAGTVWVGSAVASQSGGDSTESIVVTEQATDRILVLDSTSTSWTDAEFEWSWRPTAENGMGAYVDAWGHPDEAKLRHRGDQAYLLTTDSKGLAAVVPYPSGTGAYWAADVDGANNPHSIELLPDGNVAVVASHGNWLRLYTASQGSDSTSYVELELESGHGVYWDDANNLLWALGGHHLVALKVGGTPAAPTLTEVRRSELPTPWGHDLQPVASDSDRLWITTNSQVYQYSIGDDAFLQDYPAASKISVSAVKSVGDDRASGQVLSSYVHAGNPCTWCTDTVTLYRYREDFTLGGGQIYKARWWVDPNRD